MVQVFQLDRKNVSKDGIEIIAFSETPQLDLLETYQIDLTILAQKSEEIKVVLSAYYIDMIVTKIRDLDQQVLFIDL